MKETRKQKEARQQQFARERAAERVMGPIRDAMESGDLVITAHVCGGKQARLCPVTNAHHDMSVMVRFRDGGSVACKDCGVTAMDLDLLDLP